MPDLYVYWASCVLLLVTLTPSFVKSSLPSRSHLTTYLPISTTISKPQSEKIEFKNTLTTCSADINGAASPCASKTCDLTKLPLIRLEPVQSERSFMPNTVKMKNSVVSEHKMKCQETSSCSGKHTGQSSVCNQCYCDGRCKVLGDCCPDKGLYTADRTNWYYRCVSLYHSLHKSRNYMLVANCSSTEINDLVKNKCERTTTSSADFFPPVASRDTGRNYLNEHCARCNGETNVTNWLSGIECDSNELLTSISQSFSNFRKLKTEGKCVIYFRHHTDYMSPWRCNMGFPWVDTCNVTGNAPTFSESTVYACLHYTNPITIFRNSFCKECNSDIVCDYVRDKVPLWHFSMTFSSLLDFSIFRELEKSKEDEKKKENCETGYFYDFRKNECRILHCSAGLTLIGSNCTQMFTSTNIYHVHFSLIPNKQTIWYDIESIVNQVMHVIKSPTRVRLTAAIVTLKYKKSGLIPDKSRLDIDKLMFSAFFMIINGQNITEIESDLLYCQSVLRNLTIDSTFNLLYDKDSLMYTREFIHTPLADVVYFDLMSQVRLPPPRPNTPLYFSQIFTRTRKFDLKKFQHGIVLTDIRYCPKVEFGIGEYILGPDSRYLFLNDTKTKLSSGRFEFGPNDTILICLIDYPGKSPIQIQQESSFAHFVLTMTLLGLSMLCLLMTLFTYAMFPVLRTIPGKCNIFLCLSLSTAQALFLFPKYDDNIACSILGASRHLAWLSTFGWMWVCSFHMYRVFTDLFKWRDQNCDKIVCKYALMAYGVPVLVVSLNVIFNVGLKTDLGTGYGGPICFLASEMVLGLSFALPLIGVVVCNIIFLVITIRSLRLTTNQCSVATENRRNVSVYLKLSSLTGCTWLIGIIYVVTQNQWIAYLFTILNASQGVFIFFSYIFNSHIRSLYANDSRCVCLRRCITTKVSDDVYVSHIETTSM